MARNPIRRTGRLRNRPFKKKLGKTARKVKYGAGKMRYNKKTFRVLKMLNQVAEKKVVNTATTNIGITSSGATIALPNITQGSARGNRIGNKIFLRYWRFRSYLTDNGSVTPLIRVALVWPKRIDVAIGDFPTTDYVQQFDIDKFTVIWDRLINVQTPYIPTSASTVAINTGGLSYNPINFTLKIMKSLTYDDNTATPQETTPILFLWSNDLLTPSPQLFFSQQHTFTDV